MRSYINYKRIAFCILAAVFLFSSLIGFSAPLQAQTDTTGITLPILMYHHIRIYENKKDPSGESLSITPEKFSQQLDYIKKQGYQTITFSDLKNGKLPPKPIIITFDDGYDNFYSSAYPILAKHEMKAVSYVIYSRVDSPGYMSKEQIKEASDNGMEIGSHTWSHVSMASTTGARLWFEIKASKDWLEKITGKPIISFSYPYGRYSLQSMIDVDKAGYKYAVITYEGMAHTKYYYSMYRLRISPATNIAKILK